MGTGEAQKRACRAYYRRTKGNTRAYLLRMRKDEDADVIERLDAQDSKVGYIRQLVRGDIAKWER